MKLLRSCWKAHVSSGITLCSFTKPVCPAQKTWRQSNKIVWMQAFIAKSKFNFHFFYAMWMMFFLLFCCCSGHHTFYCCITLCCSTQSLCLRTTTLVYQPNINRYQAKSGVDPPNHCVDFKIIDVDPPNHCVDPPNHWCWSTKSLCWSTKPLCWSTKSLMLIHQIIVLIAMIAAALCGCKRFIAKSQFIFSFVYAVWRSCVNAVLLL